MRLSLTRSQRDFNKQTKLLTYRKAFLFVCFEIDIELLLLFFKPEYRQTFDTKRTSSRKFTLNRRGLFCACFRIWSLGGNQGLDKHRIVPPFLLLIKIMKKFQLDVFAIVIMALVCVVFTSCGGDDDEVTNEPSNSSGGASGGASGQTGLTAVDLGLSVKWASCNVGAAKPEDIGGRFAWGETEEKSEYTEANYSHAQAKKTYDTSYGNWEKTTIYIYDDKLLSLLGTDYDVAHVKLGGKWRIPLQSECEELINNCKVIQTTLNGVKGYKYTASNGNSIFLPSVDEYKDRYWTSDGNRRTWGSQYSDWPAFGNPSQAYTLEGPNCGEYKCTEKYNGLLVRAVCE